VETEARIHEHRSRVRPGKDSDAELVHPLNVGGAAGVGFVTFGGAGGRCVGGALVDLHPPPSQQPRRRVGSALIEPDRIGRPCLGGCDRIVECEAAKSLSLVCD